MLVEFSIGRFYYTLVYAIIGSPGTRFCFVFIDMTLHNYNYPNYNYIITITKLCIIIIICIIFIIPYNNYALS